MGNPISHPKPKQLNIHHIYECFNASVTRLDCGKKCAVYNEHGIPFCCDTGHIIPSAYLEEWAYLEASTDLWHHWQAETTAETLRLQTQTPPNQVLIECQGHRYCQRNFRSLSCRAFPFFPYIDQAGNFIGVSYYWQYRELCWVINHLEEVTSEFLAEFIHTYDLIFSECPQELDQFKYHSRVMRQVYGRRHQPIPVLHRDGRMVAVHTRTGAISPLKPGELPKFGPYEIAARLPFPDELI